MAIIKSLLNAISTYSKIPTPYVKMEDKDMRFTMVFFPLVGVIIGGLEYLWFYIANRFALNNIATLLVAAILPVIVTGGIHLDGFMDCMDAYHSYGDKEKKLAILSDPHIGAFCVIKLLEFAALYFAALLLMDEKCIQVYCFGFVISRILCGISVILLPGAKETGMIHSVKSNASNACLVVLVIELVAVNAVMSYVVKLIPIFPFWFACFAFLYYRYKVKKDFGGITGDTSGCFLCMTELLWAIVLAIVAVVLRWI